MPEQLKTEDIVDVVADVAIEKELTKTEQVLKALEVKDSTTEVIDTEDTTKIKDDIKDDTKDVADGGKLTKPDDSASKIDKAKYEAAVKAQEAFDAILEEHGYDDVSELREALDGDKSLKDLLGNRDAADIIKKAETLEKYEAHWQKQEEQKLLDEEEPDDTISRLQKENIELRKAENERLTKTKAEQDAENAINTFNTTVSAEVDKSGLPKDYLEFASKYLGVDNPANEVDVGKKTEIRSFAKTGIKDIKAFEQAVIKNYLAGKTEITKVKETDSVTAPVAKEAKNEEGLDGLRKRFKETLMGA